LLTLKRPPTHPGEVLLEEYLKPAELTQVEAARRMGIPLNRLNEIIRGRRGVSADTAPGADRAPASRPAGNRPT